MSNLTKRLAEMEATHKEALTHIWDCLNNASNPELQALCGYMLETDANPYRYLPEGWAGGLSTSTGFDALLGVLHHALYDDGELSFPIINGEPRIAFVDRYEANYLKYVLSNVEKDCQERHGAEYTVEFCLGVTDFITRHTMYHSKEVRGWFIQDAARHGIPFAMEHYRKYANFDSDCEFDEQIAEEIAKVRKFFDITAT